MHLLRKIKAWWYLSAIRRALLTDEDKIDEFNAAVDEYNAAIDADTQD